MAEDDKDRLADLLSGMAEGLHQEEDQAEQVEESRVAPPPKPQPAVTPRRAPGPPPPQPASTSAKPPARPAAPRPPAAARPAVPEMPAPAPEQAEEPLPPPDEIEQQAAEEEADDAVIVPAPAPTVLGHLPRKPPPRPHMFQSLGFRRTIIPILLTLGALCVVVVIMGFLSPQDHPFSAFAKIWFAIPALLIGAVLLSLAGMTMVHVKHDMAQQQQRE